MPPTLLHHPHKPSKYGTISDIRYGMSGGSCHTAFIRRNRMLAEEVRLRHLSLQDLPMLRPHTHNQLTAAAAAIADVDGRCSASSWSTSRTAKPRRTCASCLRLVGTKPGCRFARIRSPGRKRSRGPKTRVASIQPINQPTNQPGTPGFCGYGLRQLQLPYW